MEYSYIAKNLKGEEENGVIEASDKESLARTLKQKGFFLVSIEAGERKKKGKKIFSYLGFLSELFNVSLSDKLFFSRNLEVMIKTGMPLPRAFEILALQAKSKKFSRILKSINESIMKGQSLADALSVYPKVFSTLYQETVRIGEETGKLDESLKVLSLQMEKEHTLKSKVKTAMVYPIIVLCLTVAIGILMLIFAVPKLKQTFIELKVPLPFTTKIVLAFADFFVKQWPVSLALGFILVFLAGILIKNTHFKRIRSWVSLKIPLIGPLTKKINSALMLRTLSSLFKSGVPIIRALSVSSGALNNYYFQKALNEASLKVEKGKKLTEALLPYEYIYPAGVLQMIEVGEETGETPEVLRKLAEFYEEDVSATTERLSAVIEPFLILFIGGIVGFFAISMMQPMFSLMNNIK